MTYSPYTEKSNDIIGRNKLRQQFNDINLNELVTFGTYRKLPLTLIKYV